MPSEPRPPLISDTRPFDTAGTTLMIACCVAWGWSLGVARIGIESGIPPLTLVALRCGIAALLLVGLTRLAGRTLAVQPLLIPSLAILGLVQTAIPFAITFLVMASGQLPSGLAMVIMCTQPFWVALAGRVFLPEEPLTRQRVTGLVIGFAGVSFIAGERLSGGIGELLLPGLILVSSFAWTAGTIMGRRIGRRVDSWRLAVWQTIFATVPLSVLALLSEHGQPIIWSATGIASLLYLALFATVLTALTWFALLGRHGAARLTPFVFLQPVAAVLLGAFIGEPMTASLVVGTVLVGLGIVWVNRAPTRPAAVSAVSLEPAPGETRTQTE